MFTKGIIWWSHGVFSFLYLWAQLTLGVLSLVFLGIAAATAETWIGRRVADVASVVNGVTSFFGFDFSYLSPGNMFLTLHSLLLGLMWLLLFTTILVFMSLKVQPLSGKKLALKYIVCMMVMIGFAIPFVNLLPLMNLYLVFLQTVTDPLPGVQKA